MISNYNSVVNYIFNIRLNNIIRMHMFEYYTWINVHTKFNIRSELCLKLVIITDDAISILRNG
jgi:hypothetical protein